MKKILFAAAGLFCLVVLFAAAPAVVRAQSPSDTLGGVAEEAAKKQQEAENAADATADAVTPASPSEKAVCEGIGLTSGNSGCKASPGQRDIGSIVGTIINVLSMLVGVAAVVMVIIGGLKYIVSGGDSAKVANAKDTILFAVIGLIVAAVAQILVRFVIDKAT